MKYTSKKLLPLALALATLSIVGTASAIAPQDEPADAQTTRDISRPANDFDEVGVPAASDITTTAHVKHHHRKVSDNDAVTDDTSDTTDTSRLQSPRATTDDSVSQNTQGSPISSDRASSLIGMTVRNQDGIQLGWIKDIVFDSDSSTVAYLVLSAPTVGQNGYNEKLLAVPPSAFTKSSTQSGLILNADQGKIAAATGLDRDRANWPKASDSSWGAEAPQQVNMDATTSDDCTCWKLYSPRTKPDGFMQY